MARSEMSRVRARMPLSASDVGSLGERVQALHEEIRGFEPGVERMACALYDPQMDLLHTFVNSTKVGKPLVAYAYKLADSASLNELARTGRTRVIDDIPARLEPRTDHTRWLIEQGYRSSFTMPLLVNDELEGFLFFDSTRPAFFTPAVIERIEVYGRLVALMIRHEATAVRSLVGLVRIAREFAHLRDVETGVHLDRMSRYCRVIARWLTAQGRISDEFAEQVFLFSPLHDIGKIGVPDSILRKQGLLTAEEREQMKLHVAFGCEAVDRLVRDFGLDTLSGIDVLRNIVAGHHESLDGSGYPNGWLADQVPIEARIVTVADIFDAMTSRRAYKPGWTVDETIARLEAMVTQGKIDGECVAGLKANLGEVREILERFVEEPT